MPLPVTVDLHAHAQSPKAAELISNAAANPGAEANPHNQHVAEICATNPDRFVGLCHVSLQHPELAARQLGTAMQSLGMRGVEIWTRAGGVDLDDPSLDPF